MRTYNPKKMISIEVHQNSPSGVYGYTIWRIVNKERTHAISRNADGKDFDWMDEKQMKDFENGAYRFKISAQDAANYLGYLC